MNSWLPLNSNPQSWHRIVTCTDCETWLITANLSLTR